MSARELLGLNSSAPAISQYITSLTGAAKISQHCIADIKTYSDVVYFNYYPLGISLLFVPGGDYKPKTGLKLDDLQRDNLILDSIDIYNTSKASLGADKSNSSRSELVFASFPITPIVLPITAQSKDKNGKVVERPLQLDITPQSSGKDFVEALGEPARKGGGSGPSSGSIDIWCEWSDDGMMVEFGGAQAKGPHAWETGKDATWKVITIFRPGTKRD